MMAERYTVGRDVAKGEVGRAPPPWWRPRRERGSSDPISWSSIDKCLALGAATLVVRCLGQLTQAWMARSAELGPLLDRSTLSLSNRLFAGLLAGWIALLALGVAMRHRRSSDAYVLVTLSWFWATNASHGFLVGVLSSGFWLDQLAAAMLMLLLFGPRPTYLGMIPGGLAFVGLVVAERVRLVPYAPLLRAQPLDPAGHPLGDWMLVQLARGLLLGSGSLAMAHLLLRRIREHEARLEELGTTDALTGLRNRRGFRDAAAPELSRAVRVGAPVTVDLLDVDHFKRVNDAHGHAVGDAILTAVGAALRAEVRGHDVVGRWGGEEFVALLSGVDAEAAHPIAERLRESVAAIAIAAGTLDVRVTATVGLATWSPAGGAPPDLDDLVRRADEAMYAGKQQGRNRVVTEA
jgi:diguanylate cyclase (GGDEF)-like protein